ncbi:MAG: hypothetical protein ACRDWH_09255, partial [Acidimicrobiia bacterium]
LVGHAKQALDVVSRARDPNQQVDPWEEASELIGRTIRDGARLFGLLWAMFESLAGGSPPSKGPPQADPPPASNPRTTTIGPVAGSGPTTAHDLRRRGEPRPTIAAALVTVRRKRNDPSHLELQIEAGGYPRGLYEGTVGIGTGATVQTVSYNLYVDW